MFGFIFLISSTTIRVHRIFLLTQCEMLSNSHNGKFSYGYASSPGKRSSMEDFYETRIDGVEGEIVGLFGVFDGTLSFSFSLFYPPPNNTQAQVGRFCMQSLVQLVSLLVCCIHVLGRSCNSLHTHCALYFSTFCGVLLDWQIFLLFCSKFQHRDTGGSVVCGSGYLLPFGCSEKPFSKVELGLG